MRFIVLLSVIFSVLGSSAMAGNPHGAYYSPSNDSIFWFIHITDIHMGMTGSQDSDNLTWIVNEAREVINPAFIIASGDLTDSTDGNWLGLPNGPYQEEWTEYRSILDQANINASIYYDIPGNHDAYNDQYFAYYLANSVQGQITGQTQHSWRREYPFGTYHFLGVNTADNTGDPFSIFWPWGDYAGLDDSELSFIDSKLADNSDADLTIVFGHHPVTDTGSSDDTWIYYGAPEFISCLDGYGASLYGYGHTHRFSEELFTGDGYTGYMLGDGVFYFNIASLGKSTENQFSVIAVDCNGLSARTQAVNTWPLVLVTAPLDRYVGGVPNPYAYTVPASSANPIRALVFDAAAVTQVLYRIDGAGDWHAMSPVTGNPRLWEALWDASPLAEGTHTIEVQAVGSATRSDTVSVYVVSANTPPVAYEQAVSTNEDVPVNITLTAMDPDGDGLSYGIVVPPGHGTLTGALPVVTYTPTADYSGTDHFTFRAFDGSAYSNEATISITIAPVNDAPVASEDAFTTDYETLLTIPAPGVLGNDRDADSDELSADLATLPAHGSVTLNPDGSFTYTPVSGFSGTDGFSYRAFDGTAYSPQTAVSITVKPVNTADTVTVLAASYNANSKRLNVEALSSAQPAAVLTVAGYGDMQFNVSEDKYLYNQKVSVPPGDVITVTSSLGGSDTYSFSGGGTNQPPVAYDQAVVVPFNTPKLITLAASDPDNDPLTYRVVTQPTNGSLTGSGPDVTYTPSPGYSGDDSFTFVANDGSLDSNTAAVSITVEGGSGGGIILSVNVRKERGAKYADLTWSGATSADVNVYRDEVLIAKTANDGAYTDPLGKSGGSASYQVCEASVAGACSNTVAVSW